MNLAPAAELVLASAMPPGGGAQSFLPTALMFAAMFGIFYFLLIRPQQKQRRERDQLLSALKRGDRVVMTSGMHGTITSLSEHTVTVRVADQVRLEFDRSAVGRVVVEGAAEKDA
jgi:preprotein translocase subunit YajC